MTTNSMPYRLFLDGDYCLGNGGPSRPLINPSTGEVFAEVESAGVDQVAFAAESAQRAFDGGWRDLAPGKRAEILFRIAAVVRENIEELAQLESLQVGKPIGDSRDEVGLGARVFEYYAGGISRFYGQTIPV